VRSVDSVQGGVASARGGPGKPAAVVVDHHRAVVVVALVWLQRGSVSDNSVCSWLSVHSLQGWRKPGVQLSDRRGVSAVGAGAGNVAGAARGSVSR
jgi:hypothetical protein